mmetsp:Transcript_101651/g.195088  ORF Transcript_101651/g.195088 Transcript_101651/m.195088 type:complete len:81 (+) Transcript_101651:379-621(+)
MFVVPRLLTHGSNLNYAWIYCWLVTECACSTMTTALAKSAQLLLAALSPSGLLGTKDGVAMRMPKLAGPICTAVTKAARR